MENRARKEDVNATPLLFDYIEQAIKVGKIAGIILHTGDTLADFFLTTLPSFTTS